jgi:uncharacterized protein (DUF1330 family)
VRRAVVSLAAVVAAACRFRVRARRRFLQFFECSSAGVSCYFIALITIHDRAGYERYLAGFDEVFARYNGEVVAADDAVRVLNGQWPFGRTVVIRFPDESELLRWYESPAYQQLARQREVASVASIAVVHGLD